MHYALSCSQKMGGHNKIVEIDERKFGQRKHNRSHTVKGQWVFGSMERESGKKFPVPVPDRTANTLMADLRVWTKPGTTVISDCWSAYQDLEMHGYTHQNVNHMISFVYL